MVAGIVNERFRYRIAINNNFRGEYSYLDFKKFGVVTDFVAFAGTSSGANDGETPQSIGIYKNFNTVAIVNSKAEAIKILEKLISECPNEGKKDYEQHKEILFRSLK
jgi:hypothetical protein